MKKNSNDCDCSNQKDHENQNCNCDQDHHHEHEHQHEHTEPRKIYLTLMDGKKLECDVLDIFEVEDQSYIAILPSDSETAMLYGFAEDDQGPQLRNIENDEEYQSASKIFMERQEE